jgi:hypothetical protein
LTFDNKVSTSTDKDNEKEEGESAAESVVSKETFELECALESSSSSIPQSGPHIYERTFLLNIFIKVAVFFILKIYSLCLIALFLCRLFLKNLRAFLLILMLSTSLKMDLNGVNFYRAWTLLENTFIAVIAWTIVSGHALTRLLIDPSTSKRVKENCVR